MQALQLATIPEDLHLGLLQLIITLEIAVIHLEDKLIVSHHTATICLQLMPKELILLFQVQSPGTSHSQSIDQTMGQLEELAANN